MKRAKWRILVILLLTLVLGLAALWYGLRDRSLERIRESGVIRIGYSIEAPYAFLAPGGEVTGESPEVARRIVERLAIPEIEWRYVKFSSLIRELEDGRIDVVASGMFITPKRAAKVLFSEPTFHVQQALLVRKGNPRRLHSYEDAAKSPGVRVAVLAGSIEKSLLDGMGLPAQRIVIVPDAHSGRVVVASGRADGLALSSPTIRWMAMQDRTGRVAIAEPFAQPAGTGKRGYGGFAFRKEDRQLRSAWNEAQRQFIGSDEHRSLIRRFGFSDRELPGAVTTAEVLSP